METPPILNGRILIIIFETLSPALPSLRSREGMGVSMQETKEIRNWEDVYKGLPLGRRGHKSL